MSDSPHHVTIRLARDYEFVAEFNDLPAAGPVMFDEPPPVGGGQGPGAADMLGAAIGNCLCASLAYALRKSQVELRGLTAHVTTHIVRTDKGHRRIGAIDVQLVPSIGGTSSAAGSAVSSASGASTSSAADVFEDFCAVTASVRHGIPITVSMRPSPATIES